MKKKAATFLAASIAVASHAAFDPGTTILFAYDPGDDDTYFLDLGVEADHLANGLPDIYLRSVTLEMFLAANPGSMWTVVGAVNDPTPVAGPPAVGMSLANSGIVGTSTSGVPVAGNGSNNEFQKSILNNWIADIKSISGGSNEFIRPGSDPITANFTRNNAFFEDSLQFVNGSTNVFYAQTDPAPGGLLSDPVVVSTVSQTLFRVTSSGEIMYYTPLPASAWLFFSACGALFARSKADEIRRACERKT